MGEEALVCGVFRCECDYRLGKGFRRGCMRDVDDVEEDDDHATGLTSCPPPAWCRTPVGAVAG
jgi:hypothetical protein